MQKKEITLLITLLVLSYPNNAQEKKISQYQKIENYLQLPNNKKSSHIKELVKSPEYFDTIYYALKKGKQYSFNVKTGFIKHYYLNSNRIGHHSIIFIPHDYNPSKKYQVRFFLHGGVSSKNIEQISNWINMKDTAWNTVEYIGIYPAAWKSSKWWNYSQYENISNLLNFVKENYNVAENEVSMTGISDGATGIYYLSNFYATPFSCFFPFIGSMESLIWLNSRSIYLQNYNGLSFFIVNTKKDNIFKFEIVLPYINALKNVSNNITFFHIDTSGHSIGWYPLLQDTINQFRIAHIRNPYPDKITFATENTDSLCRKFWVKVIKIGKTKGESNIDDYNNVEIESKKYTAFPHKYFTGLIDVNKKGNSVEVKTKGIKKYSLLLSPDHFDFTKPIKIFTNGILSFDGLITKDIKTLLHYNLLDNDRTMLYGNEIQITVEKR